MITKYSNTFPKKVRKLMLLEVYKNIRDKYLQEWLGLADLCWAAVGPLRRIHRCSWWVYVEKDLACQG